MAFNLEKLFVDVFAPKDEVVTVMYDLPVGKIPDSAEWRKRREMAEEWHREIKEFSRKYNARVNPLLTYEATGCNNGDLPEYGIIEGKRTKISDVMLHSTIVICMPEFSATAPLHGYTRKNPDLRAASMPGVNKAMELTGLSADYGKVAGKCVLLAKLYEQSIGVEVIFSTGHKCYFDVSDRKTPMEDNGFLHRTTDKDVSRVVNLPSGEVCVVPNENPNSKTEGRVPAAFGRETAVFVIKHNKIVDVEGDGENAARMRREFLGEPAMCNIAEVAIGCNDKAVVSGNVLEDEKAGFHWAYGRSDHLGGKTGVRDFSAPGKVIHQDIVYAKGNPIVCQRLDFVLRSGEKKTAITNGELLI
ncbi:MAG: hypothetical protein QME66_06785 [Candidatus Eisenbacteria bacterium]|nr:hypothetical protein [Candidatus Eisenbacteria bacterium]